MPRPAVGSTPAQASASELAVYDGHQKVARHERPIGKSKTLVDLAHNLEAVNRPVSQGSSRDLIEVVLTRRRLSHELFVTGLASTLRARVLAADAVALEARETDESEEAPAAPVPVERERSNVTPLTERRLAQLPPDTRPLSSVATYDQLPRARHPADRPTPRTDIP
ncbi:hypothetical protein ACVB8X_27515 [Streptomyces sp. NRAIS4]